MIMVSRSYKGEQEDYDDDDVNDEDDDDDVNRLRLRRYDVQPIRAEPERLGHRGQGGSEQ